MTKTQLGCLLKISFEIHLILDFWYFPFFRSSSDKMKLFQLIQRNFAILGINSTQNRSLFNYKIFLGFLLLGLTMISNLVYILREATSFFEYIQCICPILVAITMIISFLSFVFNTSTLVEFYNFAENNIDGEWKSTRNLHQFRSCGWFH